MDELRVILARTEQRAQSASNNGLARAAAPVRGVSRLEVFFGLYMYHCHKRSMTNTLGQSIAVGYTIPPAQTLRFAAGSYLCSPHANLSCMQTRL